MAAPSAAALASNTSRRADSKRLDAGELDIYGGSIGNGEARVAR
jgi:hypothetical protein